MGIRYSIYIYIIHTLLLYIYMYMCVYIYICASKTCLIAQQRHFFKFEICTPEVSEVSVSSDFSLFHWSGDMVVTRLGWPKGN